MSSEDHYVLAEGLPDREKMRIRGPWSPQTRTRVIFRCHGATEEAVKSTLESLFSSSVQNFDVTCVSVEASVLVRVQSWTQSDARIGFATSLPESLPSEGTVLVISAGWVLTDFSLEALWSSLEMPGVSVIRSVAEGAPGTLEFWDAEWLAGQNDRAEAEHNARRLGVERWVSAEGLGIHAFNFPAPRVFFRRGAADKHIVDVVVHDGASKRVLDAKDKEISMLKMETRELDRVLANREKKRPSVLRKVAVRIRRRFGWSR